MNYLALVMQFMNANKSRSEAERLAQAAIAQAQANIAKQGATYDAVGAPNYKPIDVAGTQVPDTELKGIQNDPQGRAAEQQAMAELQQIADSGGLSLADMKALNDIQGNLNRGDQSRQLGIRNDFAARGQLGSGAQLAMELSGAQNAAQNANQQGESVAAQAQARARDAILQRGTMGRQMSNDDYQRKADAAKAADLIKQRNANASTQAQQLNNSFLGQGFDDRMGIAKAKGGLVGPANDLTLAAGSSAANATQANAAAQNNAIDNGATNWRQFYNPDKSDPNNTSGNDTLDDNANEKDY